MNRTLYVPPATSRDKAIRAAAEALVDAVAERASKTPREAAEAAYYPGHPLGSVEAIEAKIIARREAEAARSADLPRAA
ncbi:MULTISPECIES: hypothetical protein [Streptomyces]|uniref:hypothetical protein n=1 Tax=Streptomyces TaxID=1883 RepID=UPI002254B243|nr:MULTISPECIES: hypothetical protein [Streptomyces]MCX4705695.1 hypothetical protein [Streptomyces sp. NBC_01373]